MTGSRRTCRSLLAMLVVLAPTLLVACGEDPPDVAGPAAGPGPGGDPGRSSGDECDPANGTTVTVEIPEFKFSPATIEIAPCDSVVWENTHNQAHTSTGTGDQSWSTDNIQPGTTSPEPIVFLDAGTFSYICALHPYMKGEVAVAG